MPQALHAFMSSSIMFQNVIILNKNKKTIQYFDKFYFSKSDVEHTSKRNQVIK